VRFIAVRLLAQYDRKESNDVDVNRRCEGEIMSEAAIRLHVEPLEEGGYVATSPDVPGLVAEGRSLVEVAEIARDVARAIAESCRAHGDPLPAALTNLDDSQSFDLMIPVGVG
jgi:predicted RNase H-like HicB family nuclease